jgi:mannosylglycerate hydrolase
VDASQLARVLRRIHRRELFGRLIDHYELAAGELVFHLAEVPASGPFDLLVLRREVAAAAVAHPGEWRVLTLEEARATALVPVSVPASGLASFRVEPSDTTASTTRTPATATDRILSNGLVEVTVAADGTLDITGPDGTVLSGVGRLVDGGDRGDSYNYAPPARDVLVSEPTEITVEVLETGPLRSRLSVTRVYEWPAALSADRNVRGDRAVATPVETLVEVRVGEPFVRVSTSFLNRSADHRLRFHVPLPEPVTTSASSGQFAVTERGLTAEGGWGEYPLPTFPAGSFVSAGAATVLLDHSSEYELVGDGTELAITLLRAIGSVSVNIHPLRDEPAASEIPVPGAQDVGMRIENRFAVVPAASGWRGAHAVALAEEFRGDVLVTRGTGPAGHQLPPDTAGLRVDGKDVLVSAVRRVGGEGAQGPGTEVRLTAMSDTASTVRVTGAFTEATTVDLLGRPLSRTRVTDALELGLGPWEIHTVFLR